MADSIPQKSEFSLSSGFSMPSQRIRGARLSGKQPVPRYRTVNGGFARPISVSASTMEGRSSEAVFPRNLIVQWSFSCRSQETSACACRSRSWISPAFDLTSGGLSNAIKSLRCAISPWCLQWQRPERTKFRDHKQGHHLSPHTFGIRPSFPIHGYSIPSTFLRTSSIAAWAARSFTRLRPSPNL